jgi:hypothetical protein
MNRQQKNTPTPREEWGRKEPIMKNVSLETKAILNREEAAKLYGFSRRKLFRFLKEGENLPFIIFYNKRKLINRRAFDSFLRFRPELKEELTAQDRPGWPSGKKGA